MIKIRLAELLAERGLKISKVAKETGIARSTVTGTAQNDFKMIQLETINVLCKYLNVGVDEFFEFVPIDFEFTVQTEDFDLTLDIYDDNFIEFEHQFDFFIDILKRLKKDTVTLALSGSAKLFDDRGVVFSIEFDSKSDEAEFLTAFNDLPVGFKVQVSRDIKRALMKELLGQLKDEMEEGKRFSAEATFESSSGIFLFESGGAHLAVNS